MAVTLAEFGKALFRLKDALAQPKDEFTRDSVIQRYEFTVEAAWKAAKHVVELETISPKNIFRELAQEGLIDDVDEWFSILEARNLSSHTYHEGTAEAVYVKAKQAIVSFEQLMEKLHEWQVRNQR